LTAITALYSAMQITGVFLSYFMVQYKKLNGTIQGGSSYEMKPLPPEPDVIPRNVSGPAASHTYDEVPPPVSTRHESLAASGVGHVTHMSRDNVNNRYVRPGVGGASAGHQRISLGTPEEVPLKSHGLEVTDGVNLDSDSEMEKVLAPQISRNSYRQRHSSEASRSRASSVGSAKLKYQSEIRNLIRSHQHLNTGTDSDSDESLDYYNHANDVNKNDTRNNRTSSRYQHANYDDDEPRYMDHVTVNGSLNNHQDRFENEVFTREQYNGERNNRNRHAKSVIFGSNTINQQIHEEFRQRAKRNESFKIALSSQKLNRRGSMKESLKRSMEDLQDGFVSLSGRSSRTGSIRSRSGSVSSLRSAGGSQTVYVQDTFQDEYEYTKPISSSESDSQRRKQKNIYQSEDKLYQEKKRKENEFLSRSAAGLDQLARGLGPRRQERQSNRRRRDRSRSASRENLDDGRMQQRSARSRSQSKSRESLDSSKKQSFGKDFVNFYMGKLK